MKNVTKLLAIIALVTVAAFTIAACKDANAKAADDIQGTWKYTDDEGDTQTLIFSDKNVTYKVTDEDGTIEMKGTFEISDKTLILKFTTPAANTQKWSFEISGKTLKIGPEGGPAALPFAKQ